MSETNIEENDIASTYFVQVARGYLPEMKQLFRSGGLTKTVDWDNVSAHCIVQCVVARDLGIKLNLSIDDLNKLMQVALVHDWEKRIQSLNNSSSVEIAEATQSFNELGIDMNLMSATGIEFIKKFQRGDSITFLEKLQFYIDDVVQNRTIVLLDTRLDEVSRRKQYLNDDMKLTEELGGIPYWEAERNIAHEIEHEIFMKLQSQGIIIDKPEHIPNLLSRSINKLK